MSTCQHLNVEVTADEEALRPMEQDGKCSVVQSSMSYRMTRLVHS